ncbi:uncharacterized protein FIBRA_07204 [Fibroporia radiculosa]|uniref:GmrSD restriction endonucleases N-terminal domain-containing protein n=1 Tax=Fibroporia radiculosa TaxID=599839 RepID=J4GUI3_9APHY|nr:uncharacterized protein FIBRA_07204 [Fibroporia radiculosa]CCM05005.1 predicted protein [Fibroporia radiculosa]
MSDDDKDFDELQSDIEEEVDPATFHVGSRLDPPQARLYTTQDLHTLIHEGVIDLCPPYQRDVVWTEPKQMKLLDSIYRNFYVPPVVFAVYEEDGEEKFFDGQKSTRLEVPLHMKVDFQGKHITCVEYRNLPKGFERDIFQRVQLGMPLTAAEKLQAISSPWAEWITMLDTRYVGSDGGITSCIDVDMKRGRDFQTLAQLVYCCYNFPDQTVPTPQKMEGWLTSMDPPSATFKQEINDVLTEFCHLANTRHLNTAFSKIPKRVAPVEFVFCGVVLYAMNGCSHEDRAEELYNMRIHVRKRFPDIRSRGDIIKCLWEFVYDVIERQETGRYDADKKDGKKRKKVQSGEDDYDYDPVLVPAPATKRSKGKAR